MNKDQLNALRKAADAATPGPWITVSAGDVPSLVVATEDSISLLTVVDEEAHDGEIIKFGALYEAQDAEYIATANPQAILALLDYVQELEKDAARYRWLREYSFDGGRFSGTVHAAERPMELDAAIDAAMGETK